MEAEYEWRTSMASSLIRFPPVDAAHPHRTHHPGLRTAATGVAERTLRERSLRHMGGTAAAYSPVHRARESPGDADATLEQQVPGIQAPPPDVGLGGALRLL